MNLKTFLSENQMSEETAMNLLQNHGIISDNCISIDDIDEQDAQRAINWLKRERGEML